GSTTTDLIPLRDGRPSPQGGTDVERLLSGELVYSGFRRTPVCAVAPDVPLRGSRCPLAAEWFATMLDVYLMLGWLSEDPSDAGTANGRPATVACAHDRLARSVCCDRTELSLVEARAVSEFLARRQMQQISLALEHLSNRCEGPFGTVIVSGTGEFLAHRLLELCPATRGCRVVSLAEILSPEIADSACAYAVAVLAASG
ncbi:MAG TPA: hydantoinase/oxoprolinase family protein, partial [Planctomycetaceae bacterium]|nr:hydantoinase/oxoprolinase family protein [Planctomycetaceae bacterium]